MKRLLFSSLIVVALIGSAAPARADATWTAALDQRLACVTFGPMACTPAVPDNPGDPTIKNN